jgi:hypothetical protein
VRLLVALGLFQRGELRLAQHQTLLRTLGFQCLEPLLHGLELVTLPHAAHPSRRHTQPAPLQFIGNPYLTSGGLFDRPPDHRLLNLGYDAILQHRPAPRDLLQRRLAALS